MLNLNLKLKSYFRIQHFSDVAFAEKDFLDALGEFLS